MISKDDASSRRATGAAMREAPPEVQERVRASVSQAVAPLMTDGGMVADAATWIVHAEKP